MIIYFNLNIKNLNTFGIDAQASTLIVIQQETELTEALEYINGQQPFILGGGSNMLLTRDFTEPVLKNEILGIEVLEENEETVYVKVGAGTVWHQFVMQAVANDWAGVENLSLIPGTVGAAPIQNIGAYGVEVESVIEKVRYYHISEQTFKEIAAADCHFGYRESIFKHQLKGDYIITYVFFRLHKNETLNISYGAIADELKLIGTPPYSIKDVSDAVIKIRNSKLPNPAEIGNSGSFFKNPVIRKTAFDSLKNKFPDIPHYASGDDVKVPAGWLIEQCGWKGYRKDDYGVHAKQALVLVNYGNASGQQIFDLSTQIIEDVYRTYGINLEREVQIIN